MVVLMLLVVEDYNVPIGSFFLVNLRQPRHHHGNREGKPNQTGGLSRILYSSKGLDCQYAVSDT